MKLRIYWIITYQVTWHDYYQWGYGKLVFDDLDLMMNALKSYKADKSSNPELGDWTPYLDSLDPFRDGRAGERMGRIYGGVLKVSMQV